MLSSDSARHNGLITCLMHELKKSPITFFQELKKNQFLGICCLPRRCPNICFHCFPSLHTLKIIFTFSNILINGIFPILLCLLPWDYPQFYPKRTQYMTNFCNIAKHYNEIIGVGKT